MDPKKAMRKQARALAKVRRDHGINGADSPTKSVCICNAGLMNGTSEEVLLEMLLQFGPVEKLVMPPNQSYAFTVFLNVESAERALKSINGCETVDGRTVYAAYVESVPEIEPPYVFSPPPGLQVKESFISELEEDDLTAWVDSLNEPDQSGSSLKHRKVVHFGYEFNYSTNSVDPDSPLEDKPIPPICQPILKRIAGEFSDGLCPDQLTINVYEPGQGIPPHVDTHSPFTGPIFSLSLGSGICMQFRHPNKRQVKERAVFLPPRSLLVLDGESRYLWSHGITPRKLDLVPTSHSLDGSSSHEGITVRERTRRISLTFRKVNPKKDCQCDYPGQCDYQKKLVAEGADEASNCISEDIAEELERNHVIKVYDQIAEHFSETRFKPWPGIVKFLEALPAHSLVLDVGCGNGKYCGVRSDIFSIGCDTSAGLLEIASKKAQGVFIANCLRIAARDDSFDAAICIAVIHHLSTELRRREALAEILRVLKPGCKGLVYVWAKEQELENLKSHYLRKKKKGKAGGDTDGHRKEKTEEMVPETFAACKISTLNADNLKLPVHASRTNFKHGDLFVPWTLKKPANFSSNSKEKEIQEVDTCDPDATEASGVHHRFYHVFARGELEALAKGVDGLVIDQVYYEQGNWCLVFSKPSDIGVS